MGRFVTFPFSSDAGVYEIEELRDSAGDASKFGVKRNRDRDLTDGDPGRDTFFHIMSGRNYPIGYRFKRRILSLQDDGQGGVEPAEYGPWMPLRPQGRPQDRSQEAMPIKLDKEIEAAPGANMKDPDGVVILDPDGSPYTQPGVGEQKRDKWSGELVYLDTEGQETTEDTGTPAIL